jgi:hypothetical protein
MTQSLGIGLLLALGVCWLGVSATRRAETVARSVPAANDSEPCKLLSERLCRDFANRSSACSLGREEVAHFSDARCGEMLGRYAAVKKELGDLDEGRTALRQREQTLIHGDAPSAGPKDASLLLVVFCDFQSADCGRASPLHTTLQNLYPERARVVFRQYPASKHPDAALAAEASLAANDQGKFWEYHDLLFANPHDLGRAALERYAAQIGLDLPRFRRALDDHTFAPDVRADVALGHKLQVLEVPAVFANGAPVAVPYGVAELSQLLRRERARD